MATQVSAPLPHASSANIEDMAATAALYVTKHNRGASSNKNSYPDGGEWSSAGAAAPPKYASPQELPSFPSVGLRNDNSAAGAAASLGWASHKSPERWKPDPSASASKAAQLANNYRAPIPWQPEHNTNGVKAASLATKGVDRVEIWKPEASAWGNTAANQAFKSGRAGERGPKIDYGYAGIDRRGSLMAATGAMSGNRKRSESTPTPKPSYPDEANATANALSAATHANYPSRRAKNEGSATSGANPFTNMPKEMFTSHPPVAPEVDERRRSDVLHASAVAMAKQMYSIQQKQAGQTAKAQRSDVQSAAVSAQNRQKSNSITNDELQPVRFSSLQEAAQKLAHERLAKLHDEHAQNREYRTYYGSSSYSTNRLSIRGRARGRASSDGTLDEDREQSQKIRAQMSLFSSSLSQIDTKKRQKDREALIAIAQRNVTASLQGMDEKVFKDTGKMAPSLVNEWESKAHAAAQKKSESRMENYGKVDVGGGRFVDQSIIDAAAARNVQPVLDEINEKAEKERVRQAELKLEQESSKRSAEVQKTREKEVRDINRKLKEHDREAEKARKEEEKSTRAEAKRSAKEDKESRLAQKTTKSHPESETKVKTTEESKPAIVKPEENKSTSPIVDAGEAEDIKPIKYSETPTVTKSFKGNKRKPPGFIAPIGTRTSMEMQTQERLENIIAEGEKSPEPPKSPSSVKGWLKTKFARRHSKTQREESKEEQRNAEDDTVISNSTNTQETKPPITEASTPPTPEANTAEKPQNSYVSPITTEETERSGRSKRRASSVSSLSTVEVRREDGEGEVSPKQDDFEEARDHFDEERAPAPVFAAVKSASPMRDSRFHEEI